MRIATAWFLSLVFVGAGCSSAKKDSENLDADTASTGCIADPSKAADSALSLAVGDKLVGMICPLSDQDFYAIDVGPGMNLLDVNLAYPSALSKVSSCGPMSLETTAAPARIASSKALLCPS